MISISIKEFLKSYKKNSPLADIKEIEIFLNQAIKDKKDGAICIACGRPIWAIGSAICDIHMCFTCITGEANDSKDYEINEVNY
jgi:hypothetical protein